jgi:hypothetical protein
VQSGQGTLTAKDGSKYVGQFAGGRFEGQGTLYAADGSVIHAGRFAAGKFVDDQQMKPAAKVKKRS